MKRHSAVGGKVEKTKTVKIKGKSFDRLGVKKRKKNHHLLRI